jgi:hypothetical protein
VLSIGDVPNQVVFIVEEFFMTAEVRFDPCKILGHLVDHVTTLVSECFEFFLQVEDDLVFASVVTFVVIELLVQYLEAFLRVTL